MVITMDANEFAAMVTEALENYSPEDSFDDCAVRSIHTFAEAGVLTRNAGLVVRLHDGSEYQLTIVRSR